jgi:hypothetical protein
MPLQSMSAAMRWRMQAGAGVARGQHLMERVASAIQPHAVRQPRQTQAPEIQCSVPGTALLCHAITLRSVTPCLNYLSRRCAKPTHMQSQPRQRGHCIGWNRECGINRPNNREQWFRECRSIWVENALDWGKHCVRGRHPFWLTESTSPVASNDWCFLW